MKNYEITNDNYKTIIIEIALDAQEDLIGKEVNHIKKFGVGKITDIVMNTTSAYFKVVYEDVEKTFALETINNFFTTDDETLELVNHYINAWKQVKKTEVELIKEQERVIEKVRQEELAKQKAEEDRKKAEIKFEEHKKKTLSKLRNIKKQNVKLDTDFYTTLGWIAGHVGTISASIPDYCESWFVGRFGNAPVNVVDSRQKTSGGYSMKWNPSFSISFKNIDNMPATLKISNKKINDTEFVFDLVENYGFQFGKTQDLDKILAEIPCDKLDNFRLGLNA